MAFKVDKNGDIFLIQGDSGKLTVDGLNTDKNYRVYFAVQDKNRNTVGNEIMVNSNNSPFVVFQLTGEFTNLLKVDKKEGLALIILYILFIMFNILIELKTIAF